MPSSTSNSDKGTAASREPAGPVLLLTIVLLFLSGVETITRIAFDRVSRIQQRTSREWQAAIAPPSANARLLIIIGNSLLGAGVDPEKLRREAAPALDVRRLVVEDTEYLDWYYGIRRMFAEGGKPDVVAVVTTASGLMERRIRGDYSARYLMLFADIPAAARAVGADRNRTGSMFLASISGFWGARVEIRKWMLGMLLPETQEWFRTLAWKPSPPVGSDARARSVEQQLMQLKELVSSHGAELWLIAPPSLGSPDMTQILQRAGHRAGVRVLVPLAAGRLGPDFFADGFHLTPRGAAVFTTALVSAIRDSTKNPAAAEAP